MNPDTWLLAVSASRSEGDSVDRLLRGALLLLVRLGDYGFADFNGL